MSLTSAKKIETNKYELEVSVGENDFNQAIERVYRKAVKNIQIPGFRKGKTPRPIIERMYGKEFFWEDAVNELYPKFYQEAVIEAGIEPVDRADVEITDVDGQGFTFVAKVTVKPEVEVGQYKGLKAEKVDAKAGDAEVDAEISRLRERNARMVPVEGRNAENGDTANIDFEGFKDGVAFDGGQGAGFDLSLGSGQFIPGFEEQVVGRAVGDEFDINVTFPEDYQVEDLKGQPVVFKVKVNGLTQKELPELDDEFAKDVSEFDTLEELKSDILKKLQEQLDSTAQQDFEDALITQVIDGMSGDIPEVMYESRIDNMVHDFGHRLEHQGMNLDLYLQYTNMEMESFRKTFREQAERQTKIRLALEKIAELENIAPSEEDLEEEYKKMAEGYNLNVDEVKNYIPAQDLMKDIAVNKAIDLVRDSAEVDLISPEEAEAKMKAEAEKAGTDAVKDGAGEKKPAAKKTSAKKASETGAKKAAGKAKKAAEETTSAEEAGQ